MLEVAIRTFDGHTVYTSIEESEEGTLWDRLGAQLEADREFVQVGGILCRVEHITYISIYPED